MENPTSFDLNRAIENWRKNLKQSPTLSRETLDELETHLRDSIAMLERKGLSKDEALLIATRRCGSNSQLENEFEKLNTSEAWLDHFECLATTTWQVQGKTAMHTVTLEHANISGKATVTVNGEVAYHRPQKWVDFGLNQKLVVDGVVCLVRVIPTLWTTFYRLSVDGKEQSAVSRPIGNRTVWVKPKQAVGCSMLIILMIIGAWFFPNYADTMRMPPERAAVEVTKRYETSTAGEYSAHIAEAFADSGKVMPVFVVARDGREHARVTLSPFLGLGWQERSYERID